MDITKSSKRRVQAAVAGAVGIGAGIVVVTSFMVGAAATWPTDAGRGLAVSKPDGAGVGVELQRSDVWRLGAFRLKDGTFVVEYGPVELLGFRVQD